MRLSSEVFRHQNQTFLAEIVREGMVNHFDVTSWMTKKNKKHLEKCNCANFFIYLSRGKVRRIKFYRKKKFTISSEDIGWDFEKLDKKFQGLEITSK